MGENTKLALCLEESSSCGLTLITKCEHKQMEKYLSVKNCGKTQK